MMMMMMKLHSLVCSEFTLLHQNQELEPISRVTRSSATAEQSREWVDGSWVMGQMGHENRMGHMGHGSLGVDP